MKLSRLFAEHLGLRLLHADCYEVSHSWQPNCTRAILEALPDGVLFCLRTYGTLYLIQAIIKHKGRLWQISWRKLVRDTLRSSLFLSTNLVLFLFWMCKLRSFLGFFTWPTIAFLNSFLASAMSIPLEAKARRPMLALYLLNQASEAAFHQMCRRWNITLPARLHWLPFSVGLALLFRHVALSKKEREEEDKEAERKEDGGSKQIEKLLRETHCAWEGGSNNSSVDYRSARWLKVAGRNFMVGAGFNAITTLVKLRSFRKTLSKILLTRDFWRLPLFLGSLPLVYKAARLTMQKLLFIITTKTASAQQEEDGSHNSEHGSYLVAEPTAAAFLSGASMLLYPNTNIAMLTLWKGIECWWHRLQPITLGGGDSACWEWLHHHGDSLLYALAAGYTLGMAVLEPGAIRPSYLHFLTGLTGGRLKLFNRPLIASEFGFPTTDTGRGELLGGKIARGAVMQQQQRYGGGELALFRRVECLTRNPDFYLQQRY